MKTPLEKLRSHVTGAIERGACRVLRRFNGGPMKHMALTLSLAAGILLLLVATNALAETPHVTRAHLRCTYSDVIKCSVVKESRI